jgi:predicted MPP superfamily phosphohydrolase
MGWLGENPFHTLLLLTEKPGEWSPGCIAPLSPILAVAAGLLWAVVTGASALGWAVALGLLAFALADWALLAALPRQGLSFGPVQPPWLGLVVVRWLLALGSLVTGIWWPLPTVAVLAAVQLGLSALMVSGTRIEPFRLQVSHVEIPVARFSNPGMPVRIVQLSDLHVERLTRRDLALPALVAGLAPDLIVLTGDLLNTSFNDDPRALADLAMLLGQLHAPAGIYAVWGTVEVDLPHLLRPVLERAGVTVLEDRAEEVVVGDHRLWLMGLCSTRDLVADGAKLRKVLREAPAAAYRVLLYHLPDLMPQAASLGVDLYLAGHTHGGQWRLPAFGAILTSSHFWKRYEAGHYCEGSTHLYVSRGLGMEGFGTPRARFFCPPEVVSVTISGTETGQ